MQQHPKALTETEVPLSEGVCKYLGARLTYFCSHWIVLNSLTEANGIAQGVCYSMGIDVPRFGLP